MPIAFIYDKKIYVSLFVITRPTKSSEGEALSLA